MTQRQTTFRITKSIAGAILAGLGMLILYENGAGAIARLSHILSANGSDALGMVPAAFLALAQAAQAHAINHQRFLEVFLRQTLISSWPLLLVIFGTVLSKATVKDEPKPVQENDLPCLCPTYSFSRSKATASPRCNRGNCD